MIGPVAPGKLPRGELAPLGEEAGVCPVPAVVDRREVADQEPGDLPGLGPAGQAGDDRDEARRGCRAAPPPLGAGADWRGCGAFGVVPRPVPDRPVRDGLEPAWPGPLWPESLWPEPLWRGHQGPGGLKRSERWMAFRWLVASLIFRPMTIISRHRGDMCTQKVQPTYKSVPCAKHET
jgi:hypothetical protein